MIKASYVDRCNVLIVEFQGRVDAIEAEKIAPEIQDMVPKDGKGYRLLTDCTLLEEMDEKVHGAVKKQMQFFNESGVTEILRVIPEPDQDFGFNIMSLFHYSNRVLFSIVKSRQEAEEYLFKTIK